MYYDSYTDEELKRLLFTNPLNREAIEEAASRFQEKAESTAYTEGYKDGEEDGFKSGYAAALKERNLKS